MGTKWKQALLQFIPFAIVVTFLCVLCYGASQQILRQTADDTQVQMAQDAASLLSAGQSPASVIPAQKMDMAKSLVPFLIVYNDKQQVVASSASVNGQVPSLPNGVLDSAKDGEDHVTWQPYPDIRDAVVVVPYSGKQSGFVLAGRSLVEVEKHESEMTSMVLVVWIVCLIVLYSYFLFAEYIREQLREEKIKRFTVVKHKRR